MKRQISFALGWLCVSLASGQTWTTYTSMNTISEMVSAGNNLYCATSGGVLTVNSPGQSFKKITNTDGLGGITIEAAAFDGQNTLWFGSSNGKLSRFDLPSQAWKVYSQFVDQNGQKLSLLSIFPDGDKIWVGHTQGVSLFDRDRNGGEIRENYKSFSGLTSPLSVQSCLVWGNQIWIGTSAGVAFADKDDFNLLDPTHWKGINKSSGRGLSNDFILSMALWQDTLWLGTKNGAFRLNAADTTFSSSALSGLEIRDLKNLADQLYAATPAGVYKYSSGSWSPVSSDSLSPTDLNSIAIDDSGNLWVGTQGEGLAVLQGAFWKNLIIAGPAGNVFNDLFIDQTGRLWCCNFDRGGSVLDNQNWAVFDTFKVTFSSVAVDPEGQAWFGTYGKGVLKKEGMSWKVYNDTTPVNSPLRPTICSGHFVAVYGVAVDEQGNRWFANRDACDGTALVGLRAGTDSTFVSFKENEDINGKKLRSNSMPFCFAKNGIVWVGYIDAGLDALNYNFTLTNKSDDRVKNFEASNFAFGLVASVAVDKTNKVWIGTSGGPYKYDPATLQLVGINLPADIGPQVNSIAIDGRNNKWLGTSKGLAVLNSDGNFVQVYTAHNSFLTDDFIIKVLYDSKTGDLWVGTGNGLSRLSLPLSQPATDLDQIFAYPNPFVIELGNERVSFARLPFEARINIFTSSGEFIQELKATDQWDGRNQEGKLVATGIYLFVVSRPEGGSQVGKIALIRK